MPKVGRRRPAKKSQSVPRSTLASRPAPRLGAYKDSLYWQAPGGNTLFKSPKRRQIVDCGVAHRTDFPLGGSARSTQSMRGDITIEQGGYGLLLTSAGVQRWTKARGPRADWPERAGGWFIHASAGTGGHSAAVVGRARFELAVSWSQTRRFSGLSYRPRFLSRLILDRLAGVSKKVADTDVHIRPMLEADLDAVLEITNSAFCELVERTTGRRPEGPMFASGLGRYRLSLDPLGCHVAVRGDEVVGANFSVLRGTLGWFGPLAVRPDAQGLGIAQLLVQEFVRSAGERGATLMGLETMANSPQHVHLYMKLGFRPSWTGISFRREARAAKLPSGVEVDGAAHELNYVYPGYDAANDVRATRSVKTGVSLRFGDGLAVCHTVSTLWADPTIAYVPLIATPDRETFDVLVRAVEAVAREHGKMRVVTQVPGSSLATQHALLEHGYDTGGAALRMKRGEALDYDAGPFFYCDDWH